MKSFLRRWLGKNREYRGMKSGNGPVPAKEELELSVQQVREILKDDPKTRVLDVREPWERETASIAGTELLTEEAVKQLLESGEREARYVFHCHKGVGSLNAAMFFASHGFRRVYSMRGGIHAWSEEIDPSVPMY